MKIWICDSCQAEVPVNEKPKSCPICGKHDFSEGERKDPDLEDKKISKLYDKALKELEEYDEGCEPKSLKYSCEG